MKNNIKCRIDEIKAKYDKWNVESFKCDPYPRSGGVLFVTVDKYGSFYVTPNHGTEIGVYSKEGKFINKIDKFNFKGRKPVSPFGLAYNEQNNYLLINDLWNLKIHLYDLNQNLIIKTFSYPKINQNKEKLVPSYLMPKDNNDLYYVGDVIFLSIVKVDESYYVLGREFKDAKEANKIQITRINEQLDYIDEYLSFDCSEREANLNHDIAYSAVDCHIYFLQSGRYIYSYEIGSKEKKLIFDADKYNYQLSSIHVVNDNIYATNINPIKGSLVKISCQGEFIYNFDHEEINGPTCVTSHDDMIFIVSRANNKIVILSK
ncbi:MAG: hypothetical protein ACD_79C01302G0007 [uncultured bacterium]|nr:MAG: hypothetical protein ACD_79C01302G0007 [uncultured bacterium]